MKPWYLAVLCAASAFAQPRFEVVSIKSAPPYVNGDGVRRGLSVDGAQATFRGINLSGLILQAYRIRSYQLDGPKWLADAWFDISAKLPDGVSKGDLPEMLRALLEERFHLAARRETRETTVYALVVGKKGPKLIPKPADFTPARAPFGNAAATLDAYADVVRAGVDRPVLNMTGIAGEYVFNFSELLRAGRQRLVGGADDAPPVFFLVEQLGLKLEPRKVPLPYIVVEHVERTPTDN